MRRFYLLYILVTTSFVVASTFQLVAAPDLDPCRGGVLYGTVWVKPAVDVYTGFNQTVSDGRAAGWGGGQVSIHIIQAGRILASTRTDAHGQYRFCGLPVRSTFDLVAVPADPSYGVHREQMTITLAGGQQRNIYPARNLDPMPAVLDGRQVTETGRYGAIASTTMGQTLAETREGTLTVSGIPDPNALGRIRWQDDVSPVTEPEYTAAMSRPPESRVRAPDASYAMPDPDEPLRVISGDGLTMYFTDGTPRYMQLSVPGLDGRGCFIEFDLGLDDQAVEVSGQGHDLVSPSWGRIHVERPRSDRLTIDLSNVYTPVCRSRASDGGPITWVVGADGWMLLPTS